MWVLQLSEKLGRGKQAGGKARHGRLEAADIDGICLQGIKSGRKNLQTDVEHYLTSDHLISRILIETVG